MKNWKKQISYHLMLGPGMIFLLIFSYIPMFGIIISFEDYIPTKGFFKSRWLGLENFKFLFSLPDGWQVLTNTLIIAFWKLLLSIVIPVCFALLLHQINLRFFKRAVQTVAYLPHFLSWVILATVVQGVFAYDGPLNNLLASLGNKPIMFMASNTWFRPILIFTDTWKEFGYGSIVFLAALTSIDPGLYEAAAIDGASRWKQLLHVTLPGIMPIVVLMSTLALPNILNAGFDQIYNLYNPLVYQTGDVIDTYVYRIGMVERQYSLATAVGLLKSVIGMILILMANKLAQKLTDRKIF